MTKNAARPLSAPVRVGRTWLFADGTRLPVICGADDDSTPVVPDDLATVADDDLNDLEGALVAEFDRLHDEGSTDLAAMEDVADAIGRVRTELGRREVEATEARERIAALREQVHAQADDPDDDDDGGDDPGEGDAPEGSGPAAAEQPELVTAAAVRPARRAPASASATARRAPRPRVEQAQPRVTITAAADLPGVSTGATIDLSQVAVSMHDRARALSNGSPKVPIARFHLPYATDARITEQMSAEAALSVVEHVTNPQSLVAAGGWCTPSENMYDLLTLDGATGLLDVPSVGIARGGLNIPSYIGIDAADGALWSWSEDQDEAVTLTISDLDVASGVATVNFSAAHLLAVGDTIDITVGTSIDGPRVVASVVDADSVTVTATGVPDSTNATGFATRQKGCFRIPCPTWTDYRLAGYGLCLTHGNLSDRAFPELTRRYVGAALNAHMHRMSAVNVAKIGSSANSDAVTVTAVGTDSYGELMSAIELQATDYRSEHQISSNVILEVLLPSWTREMLRSNLAMRAGVDLLAVTDAQIDAHLATRKVRAQFLEDYQALWNGSARQAWPTTMLFLMYPAGGFVEGNGGVIDLGVVRDSRVNATNDFTAAWTEQFSLLGRRGPKARKVTVSLATTGVTACCE